MFFVTSPYGLTLSKLLRAMSSEPDATRAGHMLTLIQSLQSAGVWAKLDVLHVYAAHNEQASTLNWKNPGTNTASYNGTYTFTTDRGVTGDASTADIDTGATPSGLSNWTQNSNHVGVWVRTDGGVATGIVGVASGTGRVFIHPRTGAGLVLGRAGQSVAASTAATVAARTGFTLVSRNNDSANLRFHKDGSLVESVASASDGSQTVPCCVLRNNSTTVTADEVLAFTLGAGLSDAEATALYNALNTYKTALGA